MTNVQQLFSNDSNSLLQTLVETAIENFKLNKEDDALNTLDFDLLINALDEQQALSHKVHVN